MTTANNSKWVLCLAIFTLLTACSKKDHHNASRDEKGNCTESFAQDYSAVAVPMEDFEKGGQSMPAEEYRSKAEAIQVACTRFFSRHNGVICRGRNNSEVKIMRSSYLTSKCENVETFLKNEDVGEVEPPRAPTTDGSTPGTPTDGPPRPPANQAQPPAEANPDSSDNTVVAPAESAPNNNPKPPPTDKNKEPGSGHVPPSQHIDEKDKKELASADVVQESVGQYEAQVLHPQFFLKMVNDNRIASVRGRLYSYEKLVSVANMETAVVCTLEAKEDTQVYDGETYSALTSEEQVGVNGDENYRLLKMNLDDKIMFTCVKNDTGANVFLWQDVQTSFGKILKFSRKK